MKYKCTIKSTKTSDVYESPWVSTEAEARRTAWELTGRKRVGFTNGSRNDYKLSVDRRME